MGMSAFVRFVVFGLAFSAAATPGLNVNRTLSHSHQGWFAPRALASGNEILDTLHAVEVLRADFAFVTKEFLCISMGGIDANIFPGLKADVSAKLLSLEQGDASKNIMAPPSPDTLAALTQLVNLTNVYHAKLASTFGTSISSTVWLEIEGLYLELAEQYEIALQQYEAYGNMRGVKESMVENYAYKLQSYAEQVAVKAFFYVLNVKPTYYYEEMQRHQQLFVSLMKSITWGDVVAGIDDLTNVCQLQAMLKVSESWFHLESGLELVQAASTAMNAKSLVSLSDDLRGKVSLLNVQLEQPSCQPNLEMNELAWKNGISECNLFRELVAKASRMYIEARVDASYYNLG